MDNDDVVVACGEEVGEVVMRARGRPHRRLSCCIWSESK